MNLTEALLESYNDTTPVVAFVGAGGKSSAMMRLARELRELGKSVLVTTTTAIFYPEESQYDFIFNSEESATGSPTLLEKMEATFLAERPQGGSITIWGLHKTDGGKLKGVGGPQVDALAERHIFDVILVEADGARGKSIKCPESYEPVVPSSSTLVVGLVGIDCHGQPIDEQRVHRPDRLAALAGRRRGELIDDALITKVIADEEGLFKGTPAAARRLLLFNKCHDSSAVALARRLGERAMRESPSLDGVVIGAMLESCPVSDTLNRERRCIVAKGDKRTTAVILAAGFSRRFGRDKLLVAIDGRPMIQHVIDVVAKIGFSQVILVYRETTLRDLVPAGIDLVFNGRAEEGMGSSVRCAVALARPTDQFMFFMGDQPFISVAIIRELLAAADEGNQTMVVPSYGGARGSPALFSAKWRDALAWVKGDKGGRAIMDEFPEQVKYVELAASRAAMDMDSPEDLLKVGES